ncbi:MAG: endonuclease domain-containing protein [Deltaproteobacteria bacterium]|nr:endonuclease domain-containing protein [Deltaproteobacteria bacterium]
MAAQKAALAKRRRFSPDQIGILLHYQDHTCGICGCTIAASAACDHDHTTGEYRGLLCMPCNVTEGYIRKSGLTPAEYGARLEAYLANPPASIFELV